VDYVSSKLLDGFNDVKPAFVLLDADFSSLSANNIQNNDNDKDLLNLPTAFQNNNEGGIHVPNSSSHHNSPHTDIPRQ
jgi:hypothetical protein